MRAVASAWVRLLLLSGLMGLPAQAPGALAAVRFDVVGAPTEVIHSGRSEVLGSVNLFVRGTGNLTGTSGGGASQLGLVFGSPALAIDNDLSSGVRLYFSSGFLSAPPSIVIVENRELNGRCAGFVSVNFPPGAAVSEGDFVRIEGIRGRIDRSAAAVPGTDLYVDLQSVNDPAAISLSPDRLRVAKSLRGLRVKVVQETLSFYIVVSEGFERAFVDADAGDDGINSNDRTDSASANLGSPTNSTQVKLAVFGLPGGVATVLWPSLVPCAATGASLRFIDSSYSDGTATAVYSYEAVDQTGRSDLAIESFLVAPVLVRGEGPCNTDSLTGSATLAPTAAETAACPAPSPAPRPRFYESYEPVITSLAPSSATVGGDAFSLTVYGAGFRTGFSVTWNGSPRPTTFVNPNTLRASIAAADVARVGSALIGVVGSADEGGPASNSLPFNITAHPLSLYFPRLATREGGSQPPADGEYTGIALVNVSGEIARLKLTALDSGGTPLAGTGITNPVAFTLPAGEQAPFLAQELFGTAAAQTALPAWVKVEGNVQQVAGFFLSFDGALTRLDGTSVLSSPLREFVLTETGPAGSSRVRIANPGQDSAQVELELVGSDGSPRATVVRRSIAPGGVLAAAPAELFPGLAVAETDYLRVSADAGVVPFEFFGAAGSDPAGLNGQDVAAAARVLYAPQYAAGESWLSTLSLVNADLVPGTVTVRFRDDQGLRISDPRTFEIAARGRLRLSESELWPAPQAGILQGYLEISGTVRLVGGITFSSPRMPSFSAALPLISSLSAWSVLSHAASNDLFFTGLALLNPGEAPARAVIRVFDRKGRVVASRLEEVPARGRSSRLLTEYFPELVGVPIDSGYITVSSPIQALACFALFGTHRQTVLSAIPAQTLQ